MKQIDMMKLFVDTSNSEKIIIGIDGNKIVEDARQEKAQKLLEVIDRELASRGKSLKDISEIEVATGPGSFTGLRVGVSVANALGWALRVPINGRKQLVEPAY